MCDAGAAGEANEWMRMFVERELEDLGDLRFAFNVNGEQVRESLRDLATRVEVSSAAADPPRVQWYAALALVAAARAMDGKPGYPPDLQPMIEWLRGAADAERELVKAE